MVRIKEKLTVFHDDNSSFVDLSNDVLGFDRDTASVTFIALEDSIYIGFYKPIYNFYIHMVTANVNAANLAVKYYNGSVFTAVAGLFDDSIGFTRNGFVRWNNNQTNEAKTTINSSEMYWYKLDLSVDSSAMVIQGLNIVFSDDQDLKKEFYEASKFLPANETSHILTHVSARDEIIQTLNLQGKSKIQASNSYIEDISAFDLLDISEVKLASTYLVLSKIFFNVSDNVDDNYLQKSQIYRSMYNKIINEINLKVDLDDNGLYDKGEREAINYGIIKRL